MRGGEAGLSLSVSKWRPRFSHFPLFLCLEGSRGGGEVAAAMVVAAAGVGGLGPGLQRVGESGDPPLLAGSPVARYHCLCPVTRTGLFPSSCL